MKSGPQQHRFWRSLTIALCAVLIGGCAGIPRIDPTGERLFVWPQQQAGPAPPVLGNVPVAPVLTDPVFPAPTNSPGTPGTIAGLSGVPQDTLILTPQRVLAPVGSEVILKAALCTSEQFMLTKTKIDWLLAGNSAGEFVSIGGKGWCKDPWLPWNKPKKIDNQYATGYAATVPLTITRGTQDPSDDVLVQPGEAWASVTSPVEGISRITAMTPEIEAWAQRKAIATIYWVDVQWSLPPATVTANSEQVLTTTVRRQTDGTPLEGWIVRYQVAQGGAALQNAPGGQVVDVRTDANGNASIDVTPTGEGGNTTQITTQIIRPAGYKESDAPELIVGNGNTTITWAGGDYLPPPDDLGSLPPSTTMPPSSPVTPQQPTPPAVTRKPTLEIEIFGENEAQVGQRVHYEIVIKNVGDGPATGIRMEDQFAQGLSHPGDGDNVGKIFKDISYAIAPGSSITEKFFLDVVSPGNLSHVVSVTCAEGASAERQATINAVQAPAEKQPHMDVKKTGPHQKLVGDMAQYTTVITNTGEVPLTDVEILDEYPGSLQATPSTPGSQAIPGSNDGYTRFRWVVPRIEVGATHRIDVLCQCISQDLRAVSTVQVTAATGTSVGKISSADNHELEISPQQDVLPEGPANQSPNVVPSESGSSLAVGITLQAQTIRTGQLTTFQVVVANQSATNTESNVRLVITLPPELRPEMNSISNSANVDVELVGNQIQFQAVAAIRPQGRVDFRVPVTAIQSGRRNIRAEVTSQAATSAKQDIKQIEIVGG